jgi:hypothetical protein
MYDQAGNATSNRIAILLAIGDVPIWWTIAVNMAIWGIVSVWLLKASWIVASPSLLVGWLCTKPSLGVA